MLGRCAKCRNEIELTSADWGIESESSSATVEVGQRAKVAHGTNVRPLVITESTYCENKARGICGI